MVQRGRGRGTGRKEDQMLSNGELRRKYGIPTVSSVVRKVWTGEVIRWKTNVSMAYTEGGEEPPKALKILRERWEQHKKSWLIAIENSKFAHLEKEEKGKEKGKEGLNEGRKRERH